MLPAGAHVRAVYAETIVPDAEPGALVIDCSTIDVETRARRRRAGRRRRACAAADAPVSGGTMAGARPGTLAFMVGCDEADCSQRCSRRSRRWRGR